MIYLLPYYGRWKPRKHLVWGLGIKSMTGSTTLIEILNQEDHCISYRTSEELETDLAVFLCSNLESHLVTYIENIDFLMGWSGST